MICACIGLYGERVDQAIIGITRLRPHVDRYIIIADETVTEDQKNKLLEIGCEVHVEPWQDSMVRMRNAYLAKVPDNAWVVCHDPDEHFNEAFCNDLREITSSAEARGVDLLLINSHDINHDSDGETRTCTSNYFKNLIYKKNPGTRYEGVGEIKEVHEMLIIPERRNIESLDRKYWYEHEKHFYEIWERAARNVFIAGGGNNIGTINKSWRPLRNLCGEVGLDNWTKAREYFRRGNVDPRLKEWLWNNRFEGRDFEHEMMEFGRWYFEHLHPEEARSEDGRFWHPVLDREEGSEADVMHYVEQCYLEILGRHADQEGKTAYTKQILAGTIKRGDLPKILRESSEHKERFG